MAGRIFVVTGANRGLGFQVGLQLMHEFKTRSSLDKVIFTSRQEVFFQDHPDITWERLDIGDESSIKAFAQTIKEKYGKVDVLVNNAGIAFKRTATDPVAVQAKETVRINYYGTRNITRALTPLLQDNSCIVNVASICGLRALREMDVDFATKLTSPSLTAQELDSLVEAYIKAAEHGNLQGYPNTCYGYSKAAVMALTSVWAREADNGILCPTAKGISVTCCCPGWCKTDMAGDEAPLSAEHGGRVISGLALFGGPKQHNYFVSESETLELNNILE